MRSLLSRSMHADQSAAEGGDFKTVEQGAATAVWCAASGQLAGMGGVYCENVDIARLVSADSNPYSAGVLASAVDPELAERLWRLSEALTGATIEGGAAL
jgi:hypothetical protein